MKVAERADILYKKLKNYGNVSKSGAKILTRVDGIMDLIDCESLLSNPHKRPDCPGSFPNRLSCGHNHIKTYRKQMIKFLGHWIKTKDPYIWYQLPWPIYETLANYFESKST